MELWHARVITAPAFLPVDSQTWGSGGSDLVTRPSCIEINELTSYPLVMTLTFCYWKWPSRDSEFSRQQWWFSVVVCKRLPEGKSYLQDFTRSYKSGGLFSCPALANQTYEEVDISLTFLMLLVNCDTGRSPTGFIGDPKSMQWMIRMDIMSIPPGSVGLCFSFDSCLLSLTNEYDTSTLQMNFAGSVC